MEQTGPLLATSYTSLYTSPNSTRTLLLGKSGSGKTLTAISQVIPAIINTVIDHTWEDGLQRVPIVLYSALKNDTEVIKQRYAANEDLLGKAILLPRNNDGIIMGTDVQDIINIITGKHALYEHLANNIDTTTQKLFFVIVFDDGGVVHKSAVALIRSLFNGVDRHNDATCVYIQQTSLFNNLKSSFLTNINFMVFTSPISLNLFRDLSNETSTATLSASISSANVAMAANKKNILYDTYLSIFYAADKV